MSQEWSTHLPQHKPAPWQMSGPREKFGPDSESKHVNEARPVLLPQSRRGVFTSTADPTSPFAGTWR